MGSRGVCANAHSTNASDAASSNGMMSRRAGAGMVRLLLHVHADADRRVERDGHRLALFAQLWMPEHHFMRTDGHSQIADRRFANVAAVDVHLGPWSGVDVDDPLRQLDVDGRDLPGRYQDGARRV